MLVAFLNSIDFRCYGYGATSNGGVATTALTLYLLYKLTGEDGVPVLAFNSIIDDEFLIAAPLSTKYLKDCN